MDFTRTTLTTVLNVTNAMMWLNEDPDFDDADQMSSSEITERNSCQWDHVFADGAMFKHGNMMQGIYVHPERDSVGVYFSTYPTYLDPDIMPGYIREGSKRFAAK